MGVTQKKQAVIYRHPRGRFEIVETSWVNADGSSVRIRETVMTPQHDERGIGNAVVPQQFYPIFRAIMED
ncbi:MAG: hypothetical protein ACI3X2_11985 [Butyricicoccus porcorum]